MKNSTGNSTGNTLSRSELMFLGKLEAARKLTTHAQAAQEAWLNQGRKEGLDVDKVLKVLDELEAKFRRERPDRVMGA
jgi:hypothetical protein